MAVVSCWAWHLSHFPTWKSLSLFFYSLSFVSIQTVKVLCVRLNVYVWVLVCGGQRLMLSVSKYCRRIFHLNTVCPDLLFWLACVCSGDPLSLIYKHWDFRQGTHLCLCQDWGSGLWLQGKCFACWDVSLAFIQILLRLGMQPMSSLWLGMAFATEPGSQSLVCVCGVGGIF